MKQPLETAQRWISQAENNLAMARTLFDNRFWSGTCFQSEQTAQVALKAFLFFRGRRYVRIHSVRQLALECAREDDEFSGLVPHGAVLDRYYLSARYPDALPNPAIPFESFVEHDALQALDFASEIVDAVRAKISVEPSEPAH